MIEILCAKCGTPLDEMAASRVYGTHVELNLRPCAHCLAAARNDAAADLADAREALRTLQDDLDELSLKMKRRSEPGP